MGALLPCLNKFPFREMGRGPNAKVALPESRTPSRWPRAGRRSHTSVAFADAGGSSARARRWGWGAPSGAELQGEGGGAGPDRWVCRSAVDPSSSELGKAPTVPAPGCYPEGGRSRRSPYPGHPRPRPAGGFSFKRVTQMSRPRFVYILGNCCE